MIAHGIDAPTHLLRESCLAKMVIYARNCRIDKQLPSRKVVRHGSGAFTAGIVLIQWIRLGEIVQIGLSSQASYGTCPRCGGSSSRIQRLLLTREIAAAPVDAFILQFTLTAEWSPA